MVKKTSLFAAVAVGAAAYFVTKKVFDKHQDEIREKVNEATNDSREAALRYYQYARDYFGDEEGLQGTFEDLKQKVVDKANDLKKGENFDQALSSLKEATAELKKQFKQEKEDLSETTTDFFEGADEQEDEIVIDGRSAFGEAKEAAEFEKEHPTETFYPREK
ncbi:hypothetical protein [Liquorilactobacillus satsumensis]|uniref:YtxH domain-containing protein n=1 Tax=Liquorilactobacillus satsumensis DSM 16230 = JCM 12392 TaxID=1423801 RepID=A0A0R1V4W9_9LACO|nr:hypothetical protein [Liquorilactobacillus satsumensis]KRM00561.1 hypothetical protein FD50_GL000871 [Liquorilactobacillus satsumensis DSM 16230 = JCM 12392]MCC7667387.1 hypothetical protein [Liquorilactobacillus satsumensis]MCP9313246.1 hypothetical protein [Liquorilactobacillus satsumensis]MCP9329498.1 hypothetical protein [Liquorilactobacillus satsumensis]MCP9358173.1 hypothetical protein [Liquorilactobacillus satsumensis]